MGTIARTLAAFAAAVLMTGCAAMLEPPADIQRSVDYLRQDIEKLSRQQEELARKIDGMSAGSVPGAENPAVVVSSAELTIDDSSNLSSDPGTIYNMAMESMKAGRTEEAQRAFADFIGKFPQSDLADNAQYWMGECFYSQKKFGEAKETFEGVLEHFPFGNKVPDALYKAALCAGQTGRDEERVRLLRQVTENYPLSDAAEKAEALLSQIEKTAD